MVKNFGGKNSKKVGRKFVSNYSKGGDKLRLVDDEDELYACVYKMLGNGMCHVLCSDNIQRLCIIRNKFRGRGKRDNTLSPGAYVMIGKRSWETNCDVTNSKCDLVEVYNANEVKKLKDSVSDINWNMFKHFDQPGTNAGDDDPENEAFEFSNEEHNNDLENSILEQIKTEDGEVFLQDDGDMDVDDI